MKKIIAKFLVPCLLVAAACDFDSDLRDPNQPNPAGADPNLILNTVALDFADFFSSASGRVNPLVRHTAMTGGFRYQNAYTPQNQDDVWNRAYQNVLINAQILIPLAEEKGMSTHVAIAKILSAYTYITLVDLFGDVPQSEALAAAQGPGSYNPAADPGNSVYTYAMGLLAEARTELAKTGTAIGALPAHDVYYSGDRAKWTALANSLELKCWVNISTTASRKAEADAKITALLASNIIDTEAENFTYKYTANTVPDSRHPWYNQYYGPNEGQAGGYIGTSFMYELFAGKTDPNDATKRLQDPRWRYYFSRQAGSYAQIMAIDPKALGCTPGSPPPAHYAGYPFCMVEPGFYGRDHGDASGTPPDGPTITAAGIYPAGGRADNGSIADGNSFASKTKRGQGADGAGIQPIYMSVFTAYLKAEIAARNGDIPGARAQLLTAVAADITMVKAFANGKLAAYATPSNTGMTVNPTSVTSTATYQTAVGNQFDAATNKLHAIGREFWIAAWGNGVEAYNSYRRTGGPDILQPPLQVGAGPWQRSLIYSSNYVNLNGNANQKDSDVVNKVFWDGNAETLN